MAYNFEEKSYEETKKMAKAFKHGIGCLVAILVTLIVIFLYAALGMWLWNIVMVPLFALPVVSYWEMWGIMILAKMIFGGRSSSYKVD